MPLSITYDEKDFALMRIYAKKTFIKIAITMGTLSDEDYPILLPNFGDFFRQLRITAVPRRRG